MRILAFDTSSPWCSVALGEDERWIELEEPLPQTHSERLLPMAQDLLARAGWRMHDLDGIGFGAGPGSFTGVRIACGVAQGLAFGLDRPVVPVSTLTAIAQQAATTHGAHHVYACTDARMGEVYAAAYARGASDWEEVAAPVVIVPTALRLPSEPGPWSGAGSGFAAYPDLRQALSLHRVFPELRATGRAVGELARLRLARGEGVPAEKALPLYVRHRVALTTAERAAGARL